MWQFANAAVRQLTLREALGIGHWALPACTEPPGVTAGAPLRKARLPTLPHCQMPNAQCLAKRHSAQLIT